MKTIMITLAISLLLFGRGCKSAAPQLISVNSSRQIASVAPKRVSKDEALTIANTAALRTHESLLNFNIVTCEQSIFWAIIYDGGNSEYLVDKFSGKVIARTVPQGSLDGTYPPERIEGISEKDAIKIATEDFYATYGKKSDENLVVISCELAKAWRIVFDVKLTQEPYQYTPILPDSHAPTYIIDKRTREVLYRQMY